MPVFKVKRDGDGGQWQRSPGSNPQYQSVYTHTLVFGGSGDDKLAFGSRSDSFIYQQSRNVNDLQVYVDLKRK